MSATLGCFIADRRKLLGIDQAALAAAVGVGQQTISRWEMGKPLRRSHVPAIAAALQCDSAEVYRLAGYHPDHDGGADELLAALRQAADGMSPAQLLEVVDIGWQTYRARTVSEAAG